MLGGGEETWLTPLDPEGNADLSEHGVFENSIGCPCLKLSYSATIGALTFSPSIVRK